MPVEIKEIVIKTEVQSQVNNDALDRLRDQIMEDCRKLIKKETQSKSKQRHNR